MALARLHDPLSLALIRKLGDAGGPRGDHVSEELNNIIGTINGQIIGYAKTVEVNTSVVGNVGVGLDTLHTYTLPAGSLAANGDFIQFLFAGSLAANDNDKKIELTFDGNTMETTGVVIDIDDGWFRLTGSITRLSSTSVFAEVDVWFGFLMQFDGAGTFTGSSGSRKIARSSSPTVANLNSNAVNLVLKGEGTANDDVVKRLSQIKLTKMS